MKFLTLLMSVLTLSLYADQILTCSDDVTITLRKSKDKKANYLLGKAETKVGHYSLGGVSGDVKIEVIPGSGNWVKHNSYYGGNHAGMNIDIVIPTDKVGIKTNQTFTISLGESILYNPAYESKDLECTSKLVKRKLKRKKKSKKKQ